MKRILGRGALCVAWLTLAHGAHAQTDTLGALEAPAVIGGDYDGSLLAEVLRTRPMFARLRFRLDLWSSIEDRTQRGPRDLRLVGEDGVYDELIGRLNQAGIAVILTVGIDVAHLSPASLRDPAVRASYARALSALTTRYRGRIRAIEIEGLPNERAQGATTATDRIPAAEYAALVVSVQRELRALEPSLGCEMPRVLVGGLLSVIPSNQQGSEISTYLQAMHEFFARDADAQRLRMSGREVIEDLAVQLRAERNPSLGGDQLQPMASGALFAVHFTFTQQLTPVRAPRVWITAGSYRTDGTSIEDGRQWVEANSYFAPRLYADVPIRPQLLAWSPLNEPTSACLGHGLYGRCLAERSTARLSLSVVLGSMASWRASPWAHIQFTDPRLSVVAGATVRVHLRVTNDGPRLSSLEPWTGGTMLWIAPALGCPDSAAVNNLPWSGLPSGSVNSASPGGARFRYIPNGVRHPGAGETVSWLVAAPADLAPGTYTVAARMQQDARSFGNTATIPIDVLPRSPVDGGPPDGSLVDGPLLDGGASDGAEAPHDAASPTFPRDTPDATDTPDAPNAAVGWDVVAPTDASALRDVRREETVARAPVEVSYGCRCGAPPGVARSPRWGIGAILLARRRRRRIS